MKPLSVTLQGRMWGGVTKMRASTFWAVISVNSCLEDTKENGFCEKLKKEDITLVEMRLCSVHIIFMAV